MYWEDRSESKPSDPFIQKDPDDGSLEENWEGPQQSSRRSPPWRSLNLFIFLLNILLASWLAASQYRSDSVSNALKLPASEALLWERRKFEVNAPHNAKFRGAPRPELDEAWHDMLKNDNIRVPTSDLKALGLDSVYLKGSDESVASLSVFHSLHCLKKARQFMYREYYHQGKSKEKMDREELHVDHCIEYIREALMCKPELSMVTFRWINHTSQLATTSERGPTNFDAGEHECANWDALNSWAGERVINLFDYSILRKPKHGLEYEE